MEKKTLTHAQEVIQMYTFQKGISSFNEKYAYSDYSDYDDFIYNDSFSWSI